jgi:hypothetical protein
MKAFTLVYELINEILPVFCIFLLTIMTWYQLRQIYFKRADSIPEDYPLQQTLELWLNRDRLLEYIIEKENEVEKKMGTLKKVETFSLSPLVCL